MIHISRVNIAFTLSRIYEQLCKCLLSIVQLAFSKHLTHTAEHGQGVHRGAAGPGHDSELLESHLHRPQSNSATVERHNFLLIIWKMITRGLQFLAVLRRLTGSAEECFYYLQCNTRNHLWHFALSVHVYVLGPYPELFSYFGILNCF